MRTLLALPFTLPFLWFVLTFFISLFPGTEVTVGYWFDTFVTSWFPLVMLVCLVIAGAIGGTSEDERVEEDDEDDEIDLDWDEELSALDSDELDLDWSEDVWGDNPHVRK